MRPIVHRDLTEARGLHRFLRDVGAQLLVAFTLALLWPVVAQHDATDPAASRVVESAIAAAHDAAQSGNPDHSDPSLHQHAPDGDYPGCGKVGCTSGGAILHSTATAVFAPAGDAVEASANSSIVGLSRLPPKRPPRA